MKAPNWTPEEHAYLAAHYAEDGAAAVAAALGRTVMGVMRYASTKKIRTNVNRPNPKKGPRKPKLQGYKPESEIRIKGKGPAMSVMPVKIAGAKWEGPAIVPKHVKVQRAPPFVDTRFVPVGPVPRVVDPAQCRAWAEAAL